MSLGTPSRRVLRMSIGCTASPSFPEASPRSAIPCSCPHRTATSSRGPNSSTVSPCSWRRTAEELVFQEISTGAQDDLARATDIARSMVLQYGMSERTAPRPMNRAIPPPSWTHDAPTTAGGQRETCRDIDREVHTLIAEAHERAHKILWPNGPHWIRLRTSSWRRRPSRG